MIVRTYVSSMTMFVRFLAIHQLYTWDVPMPEGDTIWRTAAGLRERVGGGTVGAAAPERFQRLVGQRLEAVEPVGKHLLMRFSGGWTLHSHMRMTGSWHLYRPGERWRRPRHLARAVLTFEEWEAVCF